MKELLYLHMFLGVKHMMKHSDNYVYMMQWPLKKKNHMYYTGLFILTHCESSLLSLI